MSTALRSADKTMPIEFDSEFLTNMSRYTFTLVQACKNVLEPLNMTHRMLIRILMKNYYIDHNYSTNYVFLTKDIKIRTII